MMTALVDGIKSAPAPGLQGHCARCGQPAMAKCGEIMIWHWSHKGKKHCDPWWENETDWHRAWKRCFALPWQEVPHQDDSTKEMHFADVKTPGGTVLEFQNSPMELEEMRSRESFYGDMVWVVNARAFLQHLNISSVRLPDPGAPFLADVMLAEPVGFFRPSTFNPRLSLQLVHPLSEIQSEIDQHHVGHHALRWTRPRATWLQASKPVFFDTGSELLELAKYPHGSSQLGARRVSIEAFVRKHGGELCAEMHETHSLPRG